MVALNPDYTPAQTRSRPENRAGDFFWPAPARAGVDRLGTGTASGKNAFIATTERRGPSLAQKGELERLEAEQIEAQRKLDLIAAKRRENYQQINENNSELLPILERKQAEWAEGEILGAGGLGISIVGAIASGGGTLAWSFGGAGGAPSGFSLWRVHDSRMDFFYGDGGGLDGVRFRELNLDNQNLWKAIEVLDRAANSIRGGMIDREIRMNELRGSGGG